MAAASSMHGYRRPAATVVALAATLVLGVSGAITALGDTLAIHGGLDPAENAVVATLVGLRLSHPLLACAVLLVVAWTTYVVRTQAGGAHRGYARRFATAAFVLFIVQMLVGLVNVALRAPVELQIIHLLLTDLIWVSLVLTAATARSVSGVAPRDPFGKLPSTSLGAGRAGSSTSSG
jgi:heme A synthase